MHQLDKLKNAINQIEELQADMRKHPRIGTSALRVGADVVELAEACKVALTEIASMLETIERLDPFR